MRTGWQILKIIATALAIVLMLMSLARRAHAANGDCYIWTGAGTAKFKDPQAACDSRATTFTVQAGEVLDGAPYLTLGTWPNYACSQHKKTVATGVVSNGPSGTLNGSLDPEGCPACPSSGTKRLLGYSAANSPNGGAACVGGCTYNYGVSTLRIAPHGSGQMLEGKSTGTACATESTPKQPADDGECMASAGGDVACGIPGTNCGEVNGDHVCVSTVPPGKCVSYDSGGVACAASSAGGTTPTPPGPNSGTAGTPATPDTQITVNNSTVNYFNQTTVNNSSSTATTSAPRNVNPQGSQGTGENQSGDGGGGDGDTGDGECKSGDPCDGGLPTIGDPSDCTFESCTQGYYARILASPIVASVAGVGDSFPSGSCPSWSFDVYGKSVSLSDSACGLFDSISGVLGGIFLVVWAWVATRVVLSA